MFLSHLSFNNIFASYPDAIIIADLNLNVVECNQAAVDLLGYSSKNEVIGKTVIDFIAEKDHRKTMENAKKTLKQGLVKNFEYTFLTKKGDEFIALISSSVIKDASGNPVLLIKIAEDITKIKLVKESLLSIFDGITDGILIIDRDYKILRANLATLKMINKRNFSDLIGRNCFHEIFNNEEVCDDCPAKKTFTNDKPYNITKIYHSPNKEKILLDISTFPLRDSAGKVIQVIEHIKNATDRIKLEEQLIFHKRITAISELASGIAHEIRNPLGNISASAQYCLSRHELPGKVKKYLKIILKNSENANKRIKDLLNFAKPREFSFEMGDIGKVIKSTCNLFKLKCLKQHIRLTFRLQRRLPRILLDERGLIEAFSNFISNALDAMPNGGKLIITANVDFQNNDVVVSFLDTGKGISKENLNKIFDPFFTTKRGGVGLGLSLALQIIHEHKGKINIESKVDHGTEVVVRLPISRLK